MRTTRLTGVLWIVGALVVGACGSDDSTSSSASTTTPADPTSTTADPSAFSKTFDVGGGLNLFMSCKGSGSPTILLEAGDESGTEEWDPVIDDLQKQTRTCAYDRAGVGRSVKATGCRGMDDLLGDLEALLQEAQVKGPYVLAGGSGGGFLMAELAARHPADVAGLVLVEVPKAITIIPADVVDAIKCDAPTNIERRDYYAVEHAAWDARKQIGDFPMTVISNDYGSGRGEGDEQTNVADQQGWLVLSPSATQVVVTSGHDVTTNEPELVTREILDVLAAARGR